MSSEPTRDRLLTAELAICYSPSTEQARVASRVGAGLLAHALDRHARLERARLATVVVGLRTHKRHRQPTMFTLGSGSTLPPRTLITPFAPATATTPSRTSEPDRRNG